MRPWALIDRSPQNAAGPAQWGAALPRGEFHAGAITPVVNGVPLEDAQVDVTASWDDGSAFAIRVCTATSSFGKLGQLELLRRPPTAPGIFSPETVTMLGRYFAKVTIVDGGGVSWVAEVAPAQSWQVLKALVDSVDQGAVRRTIEFPVVPRAVSDHPQLQVRFRVTAFSRWPGALWEVTVENCQVDAGRPTQDLTIASVAVEVAGVPVYGRGPHVHEHGTLWRVESWAGQRGRSIEVVPDGRDLADALLCPDLDWSSPADAAAASAWLAAQLKLTVAGGDRKGSCGRRGPDVTTVEHETGAPGEPFPLWKDQGTTGDRADIGWAPTWTLGMLNGGAVPFTDLQRWADCNGAGAFNVHFRAGPSQPMGLTFDHPFWAKSATPRKATCVPNVAHHPLVGFWSWVLTGKERYWDELRAWACLCVRDSYPNDGTLQNAGDRREAWALRTISLAARAAPDDDPAKGYLTTSLTRTAAEWARQLPTMESQLWLGQYDRKTWKLSGREESPFTYYGSMGWMGAWFTAMALVADAALGQDAFRPLAEHGWKWLQLYLKPTGGESGFDLGMLVDYDAPTCFYTPRWNAAKGLWEATPGSEVGLGSEQALAHACRLQAATQKPRLTQADLPANPDPLAQPYDPSTPFVGSQWHEYGPGRCGTHLLGLRAGFASARQVVDVVQPLNVARGAATKRPTWARTREQT